MIRKYYLKWVAIVKKAFFTTFFPHLPSHSPDPSISRLPCLAPEWCVEFALLSFMAQCLAFFVTRSKTNMGYRRLYSHPIEKELCIMRRVRFFDEEREKDLTFLTNNFLLPSLTIAQLYKCRWQVELFFKWIKQHLRIKRFLGTSENAVKSQI